VLDTNRSDLCSGCLPVIRNTAPAWLGHLLNLEPTDIAAHGHKKFQFTSILQTSTGRHYLDIEATVIGNPLLCQL
jgi:hypothetical protein